MSRSYFSLISINGINVYSGNGDPNGVQAAPLGSVWSDKLTGTLYTNTDGGTTWVAVGGGGGSGIRETVIWRPAGPADPTNGVYTTFSAAHAALAALGTGGLIQVDSLGVPAVIDAAGTPYDMTNIVLEGDMLYVSDLSEVQIPEGITFTNWEGNWANITMNWQGTATPLYVVDNVVQLWRTGRASRWKVDDAGSVEAIQVINGGIFSIFLDDFSEIDGLGDAVAYEFASVDAASFINVNEQQRCLIVSGVFRGAGTVFAQLGSGGSTFSTTQPNLSGGLGISAEQYPYFPSAPADWAGDPNGSNDAFDRLAAAVAGLLGVPIP